MNKEQALQFIAQIVGKAVMPIEVYPQVQEALNILAEAIKPVVESDDKK